MHMRKGVTPLEIAEEKCAEALRILAEPTRLQVVLSLLEAPKHVGELNEGLEVKQSLLSHHLRVLRNAKLVDGRRDGRHVLYRLSPAIRPAGRVGCLDLGCCRLTFSERREGPGESRES